jgi:uncharacterized coiled-coil protein SlyX
MMNPDFDPLADLEQLKKDSQQHHTNILEIARAFNNRGDQLQQLSDKVIEVCKWLNQQDLALTDLHNRLRLLEVARQNEQPNTTPSTETEIDSHSVNVRKKNRRNTLQ